MNNYSTYALECLVNGKRMRQEFWIDVLPENRSHPVSILRKIQAEIVERDHATDCKWISSDWNEFVEVAINEN